MAIGGERFEARSNRVISGSGSELDVAMAEELPVSSDGLTNQSQSVEKALGRFAEAAASSPTNPPSIPPELEGVLGEIATVGVPYYGWGGLKELLAARMAEAVGALERDSGFLRAAGGKDYQQRRDELVASLRRFDAAPFTLQRLAEVLQDPRRQYSTTHKLMNGLERLLSVSSTLPTAPRNGAALPPPPPPPPATAAAATTTAAAAAAAAAAATAATAAAAATATAATAGSASTTTAMATSATASTTTSSHDAASNGAPATTAAGRTDAASTGGGGEVEMTSVVAVKVEEKRGGVIGANVSSNGSNGSADGESNSKEREAGGWEVESNGKPEPGRKRLKVDVKPEAPVMSE